MLQRPFPNDETSNGRRDARSVRPSPNDETCNGRRDARSVRPSPNDETCNGYWDARSVRPSPNDETCNGCRDARSCVRCVKARQHPLYQKLQRRGFNGNGRSTERPYSRYSSQGKSYSVRALTGTDARPSVPTAVTRPDRSDSSDCSDSSDTLRYN